jgi:hypothetical protein
MTDTLWKWEQLRAGVVYNRVMFNTQEEAEKFAAQMGRVEPDLTWRIGLQSRRQASERWLN